MSKKNSCQLEEILRKSCSRIFDTLLQIVKMEIIVLEILTN